MAGAASVLVLVLVRTAQAAAPPAEVEALARRLLKKVDDAARQRLLADVQVAPVDVAKALLDIADKALLDSDFRGAVAAFRRAEEVARRAGAEKEAGRALNGAALALYRLGDLAPARQTAEEAARAHERLGDAAGPAEAWNTIANVHHALAEYADSLAAADKAMGLWSSAGDRRGVARMLNNLGNLHRAGAPISMPPSTTTRERS